MLAPSALRRSLTGLPCLVLAVLFLVARLVSASSVAMPVQDPASAALAKVAVLCHAGAEGSDDGSTGPSHDGACLLCPACHVAAHAGLPIPLVAALPTDVGGDLGRAAVPPPATGPPHRPRTAAQPTGPPSASV